MNPPGRSCPLHYRYRSVDFDRAPSLRAETLYVVGGLYGNVEALHHLLQMKESEEQRTGAKVTLLFNGDFNWFDIDPGSFAEINETVLGHVATQGNVEAELSNPAEGAGCGCNYPASVEDGVVERSNLIMQRLQTRARDFPAIAQRVASLPLYLTVGVGRITIGIVHGDAESLAGWGFSFEEMAQHDSVASFSELAEQGRFYPAGAAIERYFQEAKVSAFACTHTCLPFLQDFRVQGKRRLVINNGAAGMPNFKGTHYGLLTRISNSPETPSNSLYGVNLEGVRFDALPIDFDQRAWLDRFSRNWPAGSAAHQSYFKRITEGPAFHPSQAARLTSC
jgi:hypothetical protein